MKMDGSSTSSNKHDMMTCEAIWSGVAEALSKLNLEGGSAASANMSDDERRRQTIEGVINQIIVPAICIFGIVGNILNLIVLTRKNLQCSMDHMEKSAHIGLVALAVSDMFFCLFYLLTVFIPDKTAHLSPPDSTFGLYYKTYKEGIINIFVFSSTWLTVIMALGRYVAVCRPLHARGFINLRGTRLSISSVFIGSLLINIPRFLHYYVMRTPCTDLAEEMNLTAPAFDMPNCSCYLYQLDTGWLYQNESFVFYYDLAWSIVAIFHPLLVLTVCNACLIRAQRHSRKMQKLYRANKPKDSGHRITPTLIALIVMFIVFVGPSGILTFFRKYVLDSHAASQYFGYVIASIFTNCMVLVNFSINFVLYCVISVQFRKTARNIVCCCLPGSKRQLRFDSVHSRASHTNTVNVTLTELETEF